MTTVPMMDSVGASAQNIPVSAKKVAGYGTGSGLVPWVPADWARFPGAGHVVIDQAPGIGDPLHTDVKDEEGGAGDPANVTSWIGARMLDGMEHSDLYGTPTFLNSCLIHLDANGPKGWNSGHRTRVWLADWNLNQAQASGMVGTMFAGRLLIVGVQWASPSSNPGTPVPGDPQGRTLGELNIDLSETLDTWKSAPVPASPVWEGFIVPVKPPHPPHVVHSRDQGKTWA